MGPPAPSFPAKAARISATTRPELLGVLTLELPLYPLERGILATTRLWPGQAGGCGGLPVGRHGLLIHPALPLR